MNGATQLTSRNFRRQGIRSKFNGKPNPLHPHDRMSTDTLAAGEYAPLVVADPYDRSDKIEVKRQLRCDPLARLHAHHQIDEAQYHAGRYYQRDWETAERGPRAIDPTKEAVDGGRMPEPLTDRQVKASKRLVALEPKLGVTLLPLIQTVLIGKLSIDSYSTAQGRTGARWANYYGKMFRDGLDVLAVEYGLAARR
jgi:hypothetical protein